MAADHDDIVRLEERLHAAQRGQRTAGRQLERVMAHITARDAEVIGTMSETWGERHACDHTQHAHDPRVAEGQGAPMHVPTTIRTVAILRDQPRSGFAEPFDGVVFAIQQDGLDEFPLTVWVHAAYPHKDTEAVARALLVGRFSDMTIAAATDAMTGTEIDALWDARDPAINARGPT